jgi:hypothetical protein
MTSNIPNVSALNVVSTTGTVSSAELIEAMVLVNVEISIWSARKKMSPEDFGGVDLPPDQLASLGSKNIFNPSRIDEFCRIRSEAHSFMRRNAVRFGSGYVISQDKLADVASKIDELKVKFATVLQTFMASYDVDLNSWINAPENAAWAHIISGSTVDRDHVASRMRFRWHALKLIPAGDGTSDDFISDVNSLPHLLFEEIADEAKRLLATTVSSQREEATQKAIRPFRALCDKLQSLSFIDPKAAALQAGIENVLASMPAKGKLSDTDLARLRGLALMLSSPERAKQFAQNGISARNVQTALLQTSQPSPSLVEEEVQALLPVGDMAEQVHASDDEDLGILPLPVAQDATDTVTVQDSLDSAPAGANVIQPEYNDDLLAALGF